MAEPTNTAEAFALGVAEADSCITWADSARNEQNGYYTKLDEAYDEGRYSILEPSTDAALAQVKAS